MAYFTEITSEEERLIGEASEAGVEFVGRIGSALNPCSPTSDRHACLVKAIAAAELAMVWAEKGIRHDP